MRCSRHIYMMTASMQRQCESSVCVTLRYVASTRTSLREGSSCSMKRLTEARSSHLHHPPLVAVNGTQVFHGPQVGFRDQKAVKKVVALKCNEIVNRLNRTKWEEFPNLEARREAYDAEVWPVQLLLGHVDVALFY